MPGRKNKEFSLTYEIEMLKKMLCLPITNVVFDDNYTYGKLYVDDDNDLKTITAQLYVNSDLIGTIPYISTEWGFGYFNDKHSELAWDKIYRQFEQVIFVQIIQQEPRAATAEIKDCQSLNVKDKDGKIIKIAYCNYLNDTWNVIVGGLSTMTKEKITRVTITPPEFIDGEEI